MRHCETIIGALGILLLSACVQQAPADLVQSVEVLDRQLAAARSAEFSSEEYGRFVQHWVALKERLRSDDDVIGWPWEENPFASFKPFLPYANSSHSPAPDSSRRAAYSVP